MEERCGQDTPVDIILPVCGQIIVDDQGNLLHINSSSLVGGRKKKKKKKQQKKKHWSIKCVHGGQLNLFNYTKHGILYP